METAPVEFQLNEDWAPVSQVRKYVQQQLRTSVCACGVSGQQNAMTELKRRTVL